MRVPVSWLREYVPFEAPLEEVARRLLFSSCEVDRIVRRGVADENGNLGLFRVGKVVEAGKHPNADRLQLCQVDVGEGEPRQIVCGAWNFGEGATVAVALPGAVLPDGTKLDERPLRGEVSRGMILSERELELGVDHLGIIVLDEAPAPGTPLADVLPLTETVLEIETGFNRPDLASIYGIAREVVAVAGIMGGEDSEVRPDTTELLLEAANFDALTVLRTSRRLRLRTESSTRWEKGVDPHVAEQAAIYATQLFVELAGARWTGHTDVHGVLPQPPVVQLRPELAGRLVGMPFPEEEQRTRLQKLGFEVEGDRVKVPTWRMRDVTRPVDLVEEVARFRLEEVPATLPTREAVAAQLTRAQRLRRLVEEVLVGEGFYEAYTWSLVPLDEGRLPLEEPYSTELAALRTDLELGLVESAERNRNAGVERVVLFELARVYVPIGEQLPGEPWHVAGITDAGYFGAKGALETLYKTFHVDPRFEAGQGREARTGEGRVRELADGWGFFELDLDALFERVPDLPVYEDVITFPALKQDLAFVVDEEVRAGDLVAAARAAVGPELRDMRPFDVYRGDQVGPGKKSIAFAVAFQSPERTLSDEDAAGLRKRIVQALSERFGAILRA